MIKDHNTALKEQIDLSKGILLSGPIGCGKTSIMHLIRPFASPLSDYKIKTCRELSFEFAKSGYEAINKYTLKQNYQSRLPGYCFDDLSTRCFNSVPGLKWTKCFCSTETASPVFGLRLTLVGL